MGKTNWGSWRLPSNPCIQNFHEYILIYKKEGKYINPTSDIKEKSNIDKMFFLINIESIWRFAQLSKPKNHLAPFPEELPKRLIQLYSFKGDIILDPFIGSGTTAISSIKSERNFIGYDINEEYIILAENRLKPYITQTKLNFTKT